MTHFTSRLHVILLGLTMAVCGGTRGQGLRLDDVPSTGMDSSSLARVPLDATQRATIEEAVKSRDYTRAETVSLPVVADGTYFILVVADQANQVFERDGENNNALASANVSVYRVTPQEPTLEDIYFALHGETPEVVE